MVRLEAHAQTPSGREQRRCATFHRRASAIGLRYRLQSESDRPWDISIHRICVFSGSSPGHRPAYREAAASHLLAACPIPSLRWREPDSNHRSLSRKCVGFLRRNGHAAEAKGQSRNGVGILGGPMVRIRFPPAESQLRTPVSGHIVYRRGAPAGQARRSARRRARWSGRGAGVRWPLAPGRRPAPIIIDPLRNADRLR